MRRRTDLRLLGWLGCAVASIPFVYGPQWLSLTLAAPPAGILHIAPLAATTAAPVSYEDSQQSLWTWAWNATWQENTSVIVLTPTGGSSWSLQAWSQMQDGTELLVGDATFEHQVIYTLNIQSDTVFDVDSGETFDVDVTLMSASGTFVRPGGAGRTMWASIVRTDITGVTNQQLSLTTYAFAPVDINVSLADASSLAFEIFLASTTSGGIPGPIEEPTALLAETPSEPSAVGFGGDGTTSAGSTGGFCGGGGPVIPCDIGDLSCECLCGAAYTSDLDDCDTVYRATMITCLLLLVGSIASCFAICKFFVVTPPAWLTCVSTCIKWTAPWALGCIIEAQIQWLACRTAACIRYQKCVARC